MIPALTPRRHSRHTLADGCSCQVITHARWAPGEKMPQVKNDNCSVGKAWSNEGRDAENEQPRNSKKVKKAHPSRCC